MLHRLIRKISATLPTQAQLRKIAHTFLLIFQTISLLPLPSQKYTHKSIELIRHQGNRSARICLQILAAKQAQAGFASRQATVSSVNCYIKCGALFDSFS
jgi:hypothetical protein